MRRDPKTETLRQGPRPRLHGGRLPTRVQDVPLRVDEQLQQRARPREQRRQERWQVRGQARRVRLLHAAARRRPLSGSAWTGASGRGGALQRSECTWTPSGASYGRRSGERRQEGER